MYQMNEILVQGLENLLHWYQLDLKRTPKDAPHYEQIENAVLQLENIISSLKESGQ